MRVYVTFKTTFDHARSLVLSQSSIFHCENDGGRLDGLDSNSEGEGRDDSTSTDGTCDCHQRIRSDGISVHRGHHSSILRIIAQALNESHRSGKAITFADILFLRHR